MSISFNDSIPVARLGSDEELSHNLSDTISIISNDPDYSVFVPSESTLSSIENISNTASIDTEYDRYVTSTDDSDGDTDSTELNSGTIHVNDRLSCVALNVGGFESRSLYPDLEEFVESHDIICISESKLSDNDSVEIQGFTPFYKNRKKYLRKSGGLLVLVRNCYAKHIKIYEHESHKHKIDKSIIDHYVFTNFELCERALFFSLSDIILNKNVLFAAVYIEPENSPYFNRNTYGELEESILHLNFEHICLLGDLNSRSGGLPDTLPKNDYSDASVDIVEFDKGNRISKDKNTNTMGHELLEFCKTCLLFIANGRLGTDRNIGQFTCKDASVVDYALVSYNMFDDVLDFNVFEYNEFLSDVHNAINIVFKTDRDMTERQIVDDGNNRGVHSAGERVQWDSTDADRFTTTISQESIHVLDSEVERMLNNVNDITRINIDEIIDKTTSTFVDSARHLKMVKPKHKTKKLKKQNNKPWFTSDCKRDRNYFYKAKHKDSPTKRNQTSTADRKKAAKTYKKTTKKCIKNYQNDLAYMLRSIKCKNPKTFWNYINTKSDMSKNEKQPNCEEFANMFKKLGTATSNENNNNETPINFFNYINIHMYMRDSAVLDNSFTYEEVKATIQDLKPNKAHGLDMIVNEFFKNAPDQLIHVIVKLFNLILLTGIIPTAWTIGTIKPFYKNKGDKNDPNNYRGITILSCFGKLFTCLLNKRFGTFLEHYSIIGQEQTGFRKGFSTMDNIFTLYGIVDILLSKRKRLYCGFLDYEKAFDKIDRAMLWHKIIQENICGKMITLIKNMYDDAKSCVMVNDNISDLFSVEVGVRQGENLSPVLFSLFLNDMNTFLNDKMEGLHTISKEMSLNFLNYIDIHMYMRDSAVFDNPYDDVNVFLKLFVLLYADDTIIFAETAKGLQKGLTSVKQYCDIWKLKLNAAKCKVMIFSRGIVRKYPNFHIGDNVIEVVRDFMYLGIKLNYNNRFNVAQKDLFQRASRAMFALIKKGKTLHLPLDIMIDLFDKTVVPVLLYGCEIWGFQTIDLIEKLQLKFYKYILILRSSTPSQMVYGETGKFPVSINIKARLLVYWYKLTCVENKNKLSSITYNLLYKLHSNGRHMNGYISFVKNTLIDIGLPGVWENQKTIKMDILWFKNYIKSTLQSQFIQTWQRTLDTTSIYTIYRMVKPTFTQSPYISMLINNCTIPLARFITTNNKLPVNVLRYLDVDRRDRICTKCNQRDIGDEFHYLFICPFFTVKRNEVMPKWYRTRPNAIKFQSLFNTNNKQILLKLKHFICHINKALD